MDTIRLAEVWSQGEYGSGYLVESRLILTAAHICANKGVSHVRLSDSSRWIPSQILWRRDDIDAALLEIIDPGSHQTQEVSAVHWGRLVTSTPGIPCEVIGFPWAQRQETKERFAEQRVGRINPITGAPGRRHQIDLIGPEPVRPDGNSPWAGMSGAAVLCGELVTALVIEDTPNFASRRLTAVSVEQLFSDSEFRQIIHNSTGAEPLLEPVELTPILVSQPQLPVSGNAISYTSLLRADSETVRFRGRRGELDHLADWCQGSNFSAKLLTGPGGQGKTRLARELAAIMREKSWTCGLVAVDTDIAYISEFLNRLRVPTLLIVDYAEVRPRQVVELIRAGTSRRIETPLRILLIARSAGDWWELITKSDLRKTARNVEVMKLDALETTLHGRQQAYGEAVRDLAVRLGRNVVEVAVPPDIAHRRYDSALMLQMAALASLLESNGNAANKTPEDIILEHEEPYWFNAASTYGIPVHPRTQRRAVAVASLCGATSEDEALSLLADIPGISDQSEDIRLRTALWLRDLYPPVDSSETLPTAFLGTLQPDRIAEHLVGSVTRAEPKLLTNLLQKSSDVVVRHAFIILARAATHQSHLDKAIESTIAANSRLAIPAIAVAPQSENPKVLLAAIDALINSCLQGDTPPLDLLASLSNAIPIESQLLRPLSLKLSRLLVNVYMALANKEPESFSPHLVTALNGLSVSLAHQGNHTEALLTAEHAIDIQRRLADNDPIRHLAVLGKSLQLLSNRLAQNGRTYDALLAAKEAVEVRRRIADHNSESSIIELANSQTTFSTLLAQHGMSDEAIEMMQEAVATFETHSHINPAAYQHRLGAALVTLSSIQAEIGETAGALAASRRAVGILRVLSDSNRDSHLPTFAKALTCLAGRLMQAGSEHEALQTMEESLEIHRGLALGDPDGYLDQLAEALTVFAVCARKDEREADSIQALREAARIYSGLAELTPGGYLVELSLTLDNLGLSLKKSTSQNEAIDVLTNAVAIRRQLAVENPAAYSAHLAKSLASLASALRDDHQIDEAIEAIKESVDLFNRIGKLNPGQFSKGTEFAESLVIMAELALESGRYTSAVYPSYMAHHFANRSARSDIADHATELLARAFEHAPDEVTVEWERITGIRLNLQGD
jgi:tetratricopeptide (TPR) repeat protein